MRRRQLLGPQKEQPKPGMVLCPQCGKEVKEKGLAPHKRFCKGVQHGN